MFKQRTDRIVEHNGHTYRVSCNGYGLIIVRRFSASRATTSFVGNYYPEGDELAGLGMGDIATARQIAALA